MELTYSDVTRLFDYDGRNGGLIYRTNKRGKGSNKIGKPAGTEQPNGYKVVMINRKRYLIHRLVWLWHNPNMSDAAVICHKDGNKDNNRIENLVDRTMTTDMTTDMTTTPTMVIPDCLRGL